MWTSFSSVDMHYILTLNKEWLINKQVLNHELKGLRFPLNFRQTLEAR